MKNIQHSTAEARPANNSQLPRWARSCHTWTLNVECWALNVPRFILISAIRVYQLTISPLQTYLFGVTGGCRYTPSCSAYAAEALREHGVAAGTFLAVKRICRCHPWGGCGLDPVPPKMTVGQASRLSLPQIELPLKRPGMVPSQHTARWLNSQKMETGATPVLRREENAAIHLNFHG